jgi:platelet-activating factor acetylhydrolase IB subunit beta/gamma
MLRQFAAILALVGAPVFAGACSAQPAAPPRIEVAMNGCTRDTAAVRPFVRPRHEDKHAARIAGMNQALAAGGYDVLFLGDSIVQRWPQPVLQQAFPGQKVLNLGIRGERVADMLYRLRSALGSVPAGGESPGITNFRRQQPKTVVVLIGSNDLRGKPTCYIASGTVQIAEALRALFPQARIVFLGILPRGNPQGQFAAEIAAVNRAVAATAAASRQFETVDLTPVYACRPQQPCDVAIPNNFVHPSEKGYALLTPALRDSLARNR